MEIDELSIKLNSRRLQLYTIALERGCLTDPEVLAISQEVDELIVGWQRIRMEEACGRLRGLPGGPRQPS